MSLLDDADALVRPAFYTCPDYVETIGPEVADLVQLFGRTANPEQRLLLDGSFGMDRRGRLAAFEVFVEAARQNLKTGYLEFRALGKAILLRRPMQIWTAHKESATDQALLDFQQMIEESAELSKRVKRITEGKGSKSLEFVNGCTIVFRPRTGKAGQSMSADDIDLDEYFAVEAKHEGSLLPTLSTRPNAQVGGASSAPHEGSHMQRALMRRGRMASLGLRIEPRLLYAEWSPIQVVGKLPDGTPRFGPPPCRHAKCTHRLGSEGCIADDREIIKMANPSAGRSAKPAISWEFLEDEARKLRSQEAPDDSIDEYLKERLSIGVEEFDARSTTLFGPFEIWQAGETRRVPDGVGAIGVALSADGQWIGLTGSSLVEYVPEDDPEAEPIDLVLVAPIMHTQDRSAAFAELKRLQDKHDCAVGLDEGGPAGALLDDLEKEDIAVDPQTLRQYANACAKFRDRVKAKPTQLLLHLANVELDNQVTAAEWRWVGDNQVIARREGPEAVDITLLESAVIAADLAENSGNFNIY